MSLVLACAGRCHLIIPQRLDLPSVTLELASDPVGLNVENDDSAIHLMYSNQLPQPVGCLRLCGDERTRPDAK